jgi:hypothetical protein
LNWKEELVFRVGGPEDWAATCRDLWSLAPALPLMSNTSPTDSEASSLENWVSLLHLVLKKAEVVLFETSDHLVERRRDSH